VGYGLGLERNLDLLRGTDVPTRQGVLTDTFLRAGGPDLFAAGDVAEFQDVTIGVRHVQGTWNNAALQGRVAAANLLGGQQEYRVVPAAVNPMFTSHIRLFGLVGDFAATLESTQRLQIEARKYRRLYFKDDRLVGAVVIGPWKGATRARLLELIRSRQPVTSRTALLDA
jgi:NAD(P)H-nitrite reductase large subunit